MVSRGQLRTSPLAMFLGVLFLFASQVMAASVVLGVDLGTEYIKAVMVKPGVPFDIVLTKDSRRKEAAAVAFKPTKAGPQEGQYPERLYGADALALAARFPGEVYPNLKALLGLPTDSEIVQEYAARHPALQLQAHAGRGTTAFKSNTVTAEEDAWLIEELLAMELQSIQKNAEVAAGDGSTARSIVLTVPPFYTIEEKRAIQSAAELAGLNVLGLLSDGAAVGVNYATSREFPNIDNGTRPEYHLVFDMGAGSTKASVLKFQSRSVKDTGRFNKTVQEVQVMGAGWDRTLGGDSLNNLIIDDMVNQFVESKGGKKISATVEGVKAHPRAIAKLTKEAERVRHVLSANQNTQATFEDFYQEADFKYKLARADFETMAETHAERIVVAINDALKMSGLDLLDLDSVILFGGASRTPFVQKTLENVLGSADKLRSNVNSDEAAVFGAAFRAADLSPSFRVKNIRVLEGSFYPTGLKRTTSGDKVQHQRIWSPISPAAGPPKEITLTEEADFAATFYQQIGADYKDIRNFETKNLTATVAAVKEKYPSCVDSGTVFKLGVKLNTESGEIDVVKAAIECEAEIKEGLMDGVKNLFGFGKKDQQPLGDVDENAEAETETVEASSDGGEDSESSSTTAADSEATEATEGGDAESTEEAKVEKKKIELVSIPVAFVSEKLGTPELTTAEFDKSKERLKAFAASDKARVQREEALNILEAFTYKVRDLIEDEAFVSVSTEAERTGLAEKSSATSDWLYGDGANASKDELKAKLKELQAISTPIQKRLSEAAKRPEEYSQLKAALEQTNLFIDTNRKAIHEYDEWHASAASASPEAPSETPAGDFDDLEDDQQERTMDDVLEERGPIPPLYTLEDIDVLEKLFASTQEWLEEAFAKQEALKATDDPVLLVKDIAQRREKLEAAGRDLAMKGVRNFNKKTKKEKEKSSKSATAEQAKPSFDFDKDKVLTGEDLEELLKNLNEDDWKRIQEEADKMQQEAKEQQDEEVHDEL